MTKATHNRSADHSWKNRLLHIGTGRNGDYLKAKAKRDMKIDCKICKGTGKHMTKIKGEEIEITCGVCDGEGLIEEFNETI